MKACSSFRYRASTNQEEEEEGIDDASLEWKRIELASDLFHRGEFYRCHDVLEEAWHDAREPRRCALHGLVQCTVALHHLSCGNHRGSMLEFGEGLRKLKRCGFDAKAWLEFVHGMEHVLDFLYETQMEHAACDDVACTTLDGSHESYELLGDFGSGETLYSFLHVEERCAKIEFASSDDLRRSVDLPVMRWNEQDMSLD